jgi:hypothetical protein
MEPESEGARPSAHRGMAARRFNRWSAPLRGLLACGAFSTTLIAAWLVMVLTTVMPVRDPGHIPVWSAITLGFLVFSGVTLGVVLRRPPPALAGLLVILSVGAVAFGAFAVRTMVVATRTGAHFEGYQLLMGLAVGGHGLCALAYVALARAAGTGRRAGQGNS